MKTRDGGGVTFGEGNEVEHGVASSEWLPVSTGLTKKPPVVNLRLLPVETYGRHPPAAASPWQRFHGPLLCTWQ